MPRAWIIAGLAAIAIAFVIAPGCGPDAHRAAPAPHVVKPSAERRPPSAAAKPVQVDGHYRNGKWVEPHTRKMPTRK